MLLMRPASMLRSASVLISSIVWAALKTAFTHRPRHLLFKILYVFGLGPQSQWVGVFYRS